MAKYSLKNKVVWLTGATSGIGKSLCEGLLEEGAKVIACGRNLEPLEELKERFRENLFPRKCDVLNKGEIKETVDFIEEQFGELNLTIFNAGSAKYVEVDSFQSETFEFMMNINFLSITYCIEACLELLKKSKDPYLVAMSSSAIYLGFTKAAAYGGSKIAVRYMMDSLRVDLEEFGIAVSTILPGFVKTPLTNKNDFEMPMAVTVEESTKSIIKGLRKQDFEIHYPKKFTYFLKFLSILPLGIRHKIVRKLKS